MKTVAAFSLIFLVSGCASWTTIRIEDVNKPLATISRAVRSSLPLGTQTMSKDGKRFQSKKFTVAKRKFLKPLNSSLRYYADILVRGDRRPYSVEITVFREIRQKGSATSIDSFVRDGTDQKLANLIRKRIIKQLSKRREDMDIIDDFRVF